MDFNRDVVPVGSDSAALKRSWVSPAVVDLGGLSTLTLESGGGFCNPIVDPDCP